MKIQASLACLLSVLFIFPTRAGGSQAGGFSNLSNMLGPAIQSMTALSNASIATGTANQQQGEATQNMAQAAMGAMQIAQGLLGLMAAAAGQQKQNTGNYRGSNLDNSWDNSAYQSTIGNGTSPTPGSETSGSSTGDVGSNANTIQLSPEDLRSGQLGAALSGIEKTFGIPRDDFVKALQNGVDPKTILANAPKNAQSADTLGRIEAGLANSGPTSELAKLMAGSIDTSGSSANLASVGGAGTESTTASRAPASKTTTSNDEDVTLDDLNTNPNVNLSPEVKAALAAKAARMQAEKEMKEMHGWSIFQLVHNRYKKLEPMLYGRVEHTNARPVPSEL